MLWCHQTDQIVPTTKILIRTCKGVQDWIEQIIGPLKNFPYVISLPSYTWMGFRNSYHVIWSSLYDVLVTTIIYITWTIQFIIIINLFITFIILWFIPFKISKFWPLIYTILFLLVSFLFIIFIFVTNITFFVNVVLGYVSYWSVFIVGS